MAVVQPAFFCIDCGRDKLHARSRCSTCYSAWRRFGGCKPAVLARDGHCCPCGAMDRLLLHHRTPGVNRERRLKTLCRRCHPRVHLTLRPRFAFPPWLRELWREQHRGLPEQLLLPLAGLTPAPAKQLVLCA
jgi:hypothetical protein